jgi:hypothetical protein
MGQLRQSMQSSIGEIMMRGSSENKQRLHHDNDHDDAAPDLKVSWRATRRLAAIDSPFPS